MWRRFCNARWSSDEGKRWKARYMAWLQPRLKQYATSKSAYYLQTRRRWRFSQAQERLILYRLVRGFTGAAATARQATHQSADYDHLFKFNVIGDSGTCFIPRPMLG